MLIDKINTVKENQIQSSLLRLHEFWRKDVSLHNVVLGVGATLDRHHKPSGGGHDGYLAVVGRLTL